MKKIVFILTTILALFYSTNIFSQAKSILFDCNSLEATLEQRQQSSKVSYECVLEKEVISGIWKKIDTKKSETGKTIFKNLIVGTYRTSFMQLSKRENEKTIINKAITRQSNNFQDANLFISNLVKVDVGAFPCNNNKPDVHQGDNNPIASLFEVHPNPAHNHITITSNEDKNMEVQILDITGQVKKVIILNMKEEVDLLEFKPGIYFISAIGNNGIVSTQKLVIAN